MNKIITYGTFDLFHFGHLALLRRAKELGDYLIVGVSTDKFNIIKNKKSIYSFKDRISIVKQIKYVDEVIPENNWEQKKDDILKHIIKIFVMGSDWKNKFSDLNNITQVIYLPRTKNISSTKLKVNINDILIPQISNGLKISVDLSSNNSIIAYRKSK